MRDLNKTKKSDARSAILNAARDALAAGDGALEMNDVAKRADVSVGLAYHYFGSKAGLVTAIISEFYDRYDAIANQRPEKGLAWAVGERRRLDALIDFLYDAEDAPLMLAKLSGDAQVVAAETARRDALVDLSAINIRRGQAAGELPANLDPEIAAAVIIGGFRLAMSRALAAAERPDRQRLADSLWRFVQGALGIETATNDMNETAARQTPLKAS